MSEKQAMSEGIGRWLATGPGVDGAVVEAARTGSLSELAELATAAMERAPEGSTGALHYRDMQYDEPDWALVAATVNNAVDIDRFNILD